MSARQTRLVPFDESYLDHSWRWLNDPEIKAMTLTPDFTREEQRAFFDGLADRRDYWIWGVSAADGTPIGAGGLKKPIEGCAEFWCYIGERDWWGRGIGGEILEACEEQAVRLGFDRLRMTASRDNDRSLNAYRRAGFVDCARQDEPDLVTLEKPVGR